MGRTSTNLPITASVDDQASDPLRDIGNEAGNLGGKIVTLNQAAELASKAWGVLTSLAGGVVDFFAGAAEAAMEAERSERELATALRTHGAVVDEVLPKLTSLATQIQNQTGVSGDAIVEMQAYLANIGVLPENLEAATVAAVGWSEITGKDLTSAAQDAAKAINGKTTALDKLGIKVHSAQEAINFMAGGFAQATERGQTLEGRLNILGEAWGDLEETLGGAISKSDAASGALGAVSAFVVQLQNVFASPEGRAAVNEFFAVLASGAAAAIDAGLGALQFWEDEVTPRIAGIKRGFDNIFGDAKGFIVEPLNLEAEEAKARIKTFATELADNLRQVGKGEPITLPELKMPDVKLGDHGRTKDEAKEAEAARKAAEKEEAAAERVRQAAFDRGVDSRIERTKALYSFETQQAELASVRVALEEEKKRKPAIDRIDSIEAKMQEIDILEESLQLKSVTRELEFQENMGRIKRERQDLDQQMSDEHQEAERKRLEENAKNIQEMFRSAGSSVVQAWNEAFSQVDKKVDGQIVTSSRAFANFLSKLGAMIADFMASTIIAAFLKLIGGALAAGPLGEVATFLGFGEGGAVQNPKKMAGGGFVSGGTPGIDSVPAWLMPGEYVLPVALVESIKRGAPPPASVAPGFAEGGAVPAFVAQGPAPGTNVNLTVVSQTLERLDDATWERTVERDVYGALQKLMDRGAIRFG